LLLLVWLAAGWNEDILTIIPTKNDMVESAGVMNARFTRHSSSISINASAADARIWRKC